MPVIIFENPSTVFFLEQKNKLNLKTIKTGCANLRESFLPKRKESGAKSVICLQFMDHGKY
jgi:hypothetical protein